MDHKQAKSELDKIMQQKTVSITRLSRVLTVLDYNKLERDYINQGKNNRRLRRKLNKTSSQLERMRKKYE